MKEVVKMKTLKLLNANIIYPIPNGNSVSLSHVVPKKRGIVVVMNENDELVPTKIVIDW